MALTFGLQLVKWRRISSGVTVELNTRPQHDVSIGQKIEIGMLSMSIGHVAHRGRRLQRLPRLELVPVKHHLELHARQG